MIGVRRLPPIWLMGFCNFLQGANGAVMLIAVPQLLAAMRVPEPRISLIVAIGLLPSVTSFVFAPILDWRISRRSYAILLAALAALFQLLALAFVRDLVWLTVFLFLTYTAVMLYVAATGGWLAGLTGVDEKNRLGAWLTVWNVGGGGVVALFAVTLLRDFRSLSARPFSALFCWRRCRSFCGCPPLLPMDALRGRAFAISCTISPFCSASRTFSGRCCSSRCPRHRFL